MPCSTVVLCGISSLFRLLSPCLGQIVHALLTRPPLALNRSPPLARLACVKHAASVRPEPGSNSDVQSSSVPGLLHPNPAIHSFYESDCLFFCLLSVSFSRICCCLADNDDDYTPICPICQYLFSSFFEENRTYQKPYNI